MSVFDLIRELKNGTPRLKKTAKTLEITGWSCIGIGVWNFIVPKLAPSGSRLGLPALFPLIALLSLAAIGSLFILSSRLLKTGSAKGVKTGQAAIALLAIAIIGFTITMFGIGGSLPPEMPFRIFFGFFLCLVTGQFLVPAYYGFHYLGRIGFEESVLPEPGIQSNGDSPETTYKEALLPFGVIGSFAVILGALMTIVSLVTRFYGMEMMPAAFIPGFMLIFLGPVIYNQLSSKFEKTRTVISSYTGGGSIFMFHGSWPFFRLLIYNDGVEVRVMFHRFFIPYGKMRDLPDKVGFFTGGLLIKSDLPGVPSNIRFVTFGTNAVIQAIANARTP